MNEIVKNKINSKINLLFYIIAVLIILVGLFLRLKYYFGNMPFSQDECLLSICLYEKKFYEFFLGLNNDVKIPPFFGILVYSLLKIAGHTFETFRIIPMFSSCASVILFFLLLKNYLKSKLAVLLGLAIFAVNFRMIFYTAETRPYSWDVMWCIIFLILYKSFSIKNITYKRVFLYFIISCGAVLTSFPLMFIIPAMVIAKCIEEKTYNFKSLIILFGVMTACLYLYLIDLNLYKFMNNFWSNAIDGFLELNVKSFCFLFDQLYRYLFSEININLLKLPHIAIYNFMEILSVLGVIVFIRQKNTDCLCLFFIILINLAASYFKIYPFAQRVCLYLLPVLIIFSVKIIDIQFKMNSVVNKVIEILFKLSASLIVLIIVFYSYSDTYSYAVFKRMGDNQIYSKVLRLKNLEFSKNLLENYKEDEKMIIVHERYIALKSYNYYFNFNKNLMLYPYQPFSQEEADNFVMDKLNSLDLKKLWIIGQFNSYSPTADVNLIETELQKKKVKYDKYNDNQYYVFHIL